MAFTATTSLWSRERGNRVVDFNRGVFNILVCLWVFAAVRPKPSGADAARQKFSKAIAQNQTHTRSPENNASSTPEDYSQRAPNLPGDPSEIREHVVQRTAGALLALINRFRLSSRRSSRGPARLKETSAANASSAGKEVDFYFTKPSIKGELRRLSLTH
jgi:hypothetical protein